MSDVGITEIAIGAAAIVALVGYVSFLVRPAWSSYGRMWEKLAASFLTLYMLVTFAAVGGAIGLAIFLVYADSV